MLRVCIASIQNVECSLLLLAVSASDNYMFDLELHSVFFDRWYRPNSIEVVDEWLHLGHMINKHFTDDTDITLCKNRLI